MKLDLRCEACGRWLGISKGEHIKYFSTFSGVGGFELGIQKACPEAVCVGYSEIDKYAESVFKLAKEAKYMAYPIILKVMKNGTNRFLRKEKPQRLVA